MQPAVAKAWLRTLAILHILGGLSLPLLLQTPLFDLYQASNSMLLDLLPPGYPVPDQAAFQVGLFGPTIASWGILFLFAVNTAFEQPSPSGWWTLLLAVLAWAPYDAALSLQQGIYINVPVDLGVLASIVLPLLFTRRHFFGRLAAG